MRATYPAGKLNSTEYQVRLASFGLLLLNGWVGWQLLAHDQLQLFGCEVGDIVGLPLAVVGIGLGIKLCGLPRSFALGHCLLFIYSFGVFSTLIPYFTVHGSARFQQLLALRHFWS